MFGAIRDMVIGFSELIVGNEEKKTKGFILRLIDALFEGLGKIG